MDRDWGTEGKKRDLEERRIREGTRGKRENREPESSKGRERDSPLIFLFNING